MLLSEAGLALAYPKLWRSLGRLELVDPWLMEDHRASLGQAGPGQAVILGDSVLYGSALREHGGSGWRQGSLGQALQAGFADRGIKCLELSGDGLYPSDLEALWRSYGPALTGPVVVELNPRMFAAEAGSTSTAFSRPFLAPGASADASDRVSRASRLFRYCRLASHLLWQPSRIQALNALFNKALPPRSGEDPDAGLEDALLNMKIQPYYSAGVMGPQHAGWLALERLASALPKHPGPVLVFLTPQNGARIADVVDAAPYRANRKKVEALFTGKGLLYRDWADRVPSRGAFLDHCHLDAAGDQELAAWVLKELP